MWFVVGARFGGCDARTQGASIALAIGATEDAAARPRARSDDTAPILNRVLTLLCLSDGGRRGRSTGRRGELPGRVDPLPAPAPPAHPGALLLCPARRRARRRVRRRPARGARRARGGGGGDLHGRAALAGPPQRAADRARVRPPARAVPAVDRGEPDG